MRFGILGLGRIAKRVLVPAITLEDHTISVIGSSRRDSPDEFRGQIFTDYVEAIQSGLCDAVYIALPNHLHYPIAIEAIKAGLPVLCEKPLGIYASQVASLETVALSNQVLIQEAFMVAHHPQWHWIRSKIPTDEQVHLSVQFHYNNRDLANIRNRADCGGGARLDIGCYALWVADWLGARSLKVVQGHQLIENGIDAQSAGSLVFGENITLQMDVSMRRSRYQQVIIQTQESCWVIPRPFNPNSEAVIWEMDDKGVAREITFIGEQYRLMVADFCEGIRTGRTTDLGSSKRIAGWSDVMSDEFERRIQP